MSKTSTNMLRGLLSSTLSALFFLTLAFQPAMAQLDTEFWFAPPELTASTLESSRRDRPIQLVISTLEKAAAVQVLQPADLTFAPILLSIPANSTQIIDLTPFLDRLESKPHNTVLKTGLYIKSTASISVYYEIKSPNNTDIFALKGANANGRLFYTPFQTHWDNSLANGNILYNPITFASFDIVATDDTTNVTITPAKPIMGHSAGVPFTITLNRGQVYSCRAIDRFGKNHPYGSKIESDKDIAVTVKDDMLRFYSDTIVGSGPGADIAGDQLIPVEFTGTDYVLIKGGLANNSDRTYILATEDNTVVRLNGSPTPVATLNTGEQFELVMDQPTYFLKASKKVYAWHISGISDQVAGAIIPALSCTGTNQIGFNRTTSNTFIINVITKDVAKDKFTLNGNPNLVPASAFQPVQGSNGWVYARITFSPSQVPAGSTLLLKNSSSELFHVGVTNYAAGVGSNYGYFSNFSRLNLGTSKTLCVGDTALLDAGPAKTQYLWSTGETTRFIETQVPGKYWVNTLSGSQCPKSDTVRVKFYEPFFNIGADDTICIGGSHLIQPNGVFTFTWQDGSTNQTYLATQPGVYWAQVADFQGCTTRDSLLISESPRPVTPVASVGDTVCLGGSVTLSMNSLANATYAWLDPDSNLISGKTIVVNTGNQPVGGYKAFFKVDGCESFFDTAFIGAINPPKIDLGHDTVLCNLNGNLVLDPGINKTGYSYQWDNATTDSSRSVTQSGSYFVDVKDNSGCSSSDTIQVTFQQLPLSVVFTGANTFCSGTNATFGVTQEPGIEYNWIGPNGFTTTGNTVNLNAIQTSQAGNYSVVPNQNGCLGPASSVLIQVNAAPTIDLGKDTSSCIAFSLVLDPIAHSEGLNILWNNIIVDSSLAVSDEGTYTVLVSNGVCSSRDTIVVDFGLGPEAVTFSGSTTFCEGSDAEFGVLGISGESYIWTGPNGFTSTSNDTILTNIQLNQAGQYTVTPSLPGCSGTPATFTISVNPTPDISLGPDQSFCPSGTLVLDPTNPNIELFYTWNTSSTDSSITISTPGTYSVSVTLDGLCFSEDTIDVSLGQGPGPITLTGLTSYCSGADAIFGVIAQPNITYSWTGPNGFSFSGPTISMPSIQTNQAGDYQVTPTLNGCNGLTANLPVLVGQSPTISLGPDFSSCSSTSFMLDPIANGAGLTYLWSTTSTDSAILVNSSGQYSVIVSSSFCASYDTIQVELGTIPTPVTFTGSNSFCQGQSATFGVVSESGVSYSWTGPNGFTTTGNSINLPNIQLSQAGDYTVIPKIGNCSGSAQSTSIAVLSAPIIELGTNQVTCIGTPVTLDPTPNGAGLTYLWSTSATDSSISVSTSGDYSVIVSAGGTCSSFDSVSVIFNTPPAQPVIQSASPYCQGSTATFSVTSVAGVSYSWTGPNGFTGTGSSISILNIQPGQAGSYTVTPSIGTCDGPTESTVIAVTPSPVIELGTDQATCVGTPITLDPTPNGAGLTYLWSNSSTDSSITVTATGDYSVIVSAGGVCSSFDTVHVTFDSPPAQPVIQGNDTFCQGSNATFGVTPVTGVSYAWTGPNGFSLNGPSVTLPNIQPNQAGVYSVTPSKDGCSGTLTSITLSIGLAPNAYLGVDDTICGSAPTTLDPGIDQPGYTYFWNFGATDSSIVVNQSGEYSVTVTFAGCSKSDTINLLYTTLPLPVTIVGNEAQCAGNDLTLDLQGTQTGTIYQWTGPNGYQASGYPIVISNLTNSSSGTYTVTPVSLGCPGFASFINVTVNPTPTVNLGLDLAACTGVSFVLDPVTVSTGLAFEWNTGSTDSNLVVSQSGQYIVKVSNSFNCSASDTINVLFTPIPVQVQFTGDSLYCLGENAAFGVQSQFEVSNAWAGPGGFTFSGDAISIPNIQLSQAGYYTVLPSILGCQGVMDSIYVSVGEVPAVYLGPDTSFCGPGSYTLSVAPSPGLSFEWSTGSVSNEINVGSTGKYFVTVTNSAFCSFTDTVLVAFNPLPEPITILSGSKTVCQTEGFTFSVESHPGEEYAWTGPNGFFANGSTVFGTNAQAQSAGTYTVMAMVQSCMGEMAQVMLSVNPTPVALVSVDTLLCNGLTTIATSQSTTGSQLLWSDFSSEATGQFRVGTHWLRVTKDGCSASDTFTIHNSGPAADFKILPVDQIIVYEETQFIDQSVKGLSPLASWEWNLGFDQLRNTQNTSYTYRSGSEVDVQLIVKDQAGCSDTALRTYKIEEAKGWFIPNMFTPNNDQSNDSFEVRDLASYPGTSVFIIDRWGRKIYESSNYKNDWKGDDLKAGVYFYEIVRSDGQKFSGYVTLEY